MTPEEKALRALCIRKAPVENVVAGFNAARDRMAEMGMTTPRRVAYLLGQSAHESSGFSRNVENLNYSAERLMKVWPSRFKTLAAAKPCARNPKELANKVYGSRMGNCGGNDGWTYRGRGYLQLTGRDNYAAYGSMLDLPLVSEPDLAREPETAWIIAAAYFSARKRRGKSLWEWADEENDREVTKGINGGTHGLTDRVRRTDIALEALEPTIVPTPIPRPVPAPEAIVTAALDRTGASSWWGRWF